MKDIRMLYSFNAWANSRVLNAIRSLREEEFSRDLGISHKSVKGTLIHLLLGEWRWTQFWRGISQKETLEQTEGRWEKELADLGAIEGRWRALEADQRSFLNSLTDEQLQKKLEDRRGEFPLAQMMIHLVNHSSYHRGQIVGLIRQLGHTPPSTGFLEFLRH